MHAPKRKSASTWRVSHRTPEKSFESSADKCGEHAFEVGPSQALDCFRQIQALSSTRPIVAHDPIVAHYFAQTLDPTPIAKRASQLSYRSLCTRVSQYRTIPPKNVCPVALSSVSLSLYIYIYISLSLYLSFSLLFFSLSLFFPSGACGTWCF